ncbi:uncharacterized protein LOC103848136 [Brassica rapa]|uniref:uncharacterized protein LOC103848136 n=1 Tax=Brassica campestris TaxID=3711 RepID=UPI00142D859D|nr:uncharacterized protein LOC103848136 [Brassica rapa]
MAPATGHKNVSKLLYRIEPSHRLTCHTTRKRSSNNGVLRRNYFLVNLHQLYNAITTQLTQESPDGLPVTLSTEEADRIFEELAPRKKGRIVGIGSVNEVARATSSYTSTRDEETSQMKARMDSQQVRLDSLEDLLDVMAVGNPLMQRMLSDRRAALGLPVRDPQESDPTRQQPSNPTDYFDDM